MTGQLLYSASRCLYYLEPFVIYISIINIALFLSITFMTVSHCLLQAFVGQKEVIHDKSGRPILPVSSAVRQNFIIFYL